MKRLATIIAITAAIAAGGALAAGTAAPSPLIYPAETIPIAFDHAQHARLGATCESCHQSAQTSTSASDNLIPREAACRSCHKIDRAQPTKAVPHGQGAARCDACHLDDKGGKWLPSDATVEMGTLGGSPKPPANGSAGQSPSSPARSGAPVEPPRVVLARPNLKFNHKLH